LGGKPEAVGAI